MTPEEHKNLPKKRAYRNEIDAYYRLYAAMSTVVEAEENLEKRVRLIPGGWRDLRMIHTKLRNLLKCTLCTFEEEKQKSIKLHSKYIRLRTTFGPEASKDPESMVLPMDDLGVLVFAASQECKLRMCPAAECAQCQLGRVLDGTSFISRGDRAWWEVFDQAKRRDVGMEDAG